MGVTWWHWRATWSICWVKTPQSTRYWSRRWWSRGSGRLCVTPAGAWLISSVWKATSPRPTSTTRTLTLTWSATLKRTQPRRWQPKVRGLHAPQSRQSQSCQTRVKLKPRWIKLSQTLLCDANTNLVKAVRQPLWYIARNRPRLQPTKSQKTTYLIFHISQKLPFYDNYCHRLRSTCLFPPGLASIRRYIYIFYCPTER